MANGTRADPVTCFRCRHTTTSRTNIDTAGLSQRFRLEYGPGAVDTNQVTEMLKDVDKDLEDYESETLLLQSRILYIETQQTRLKKHAVDLRSLNAPIRKVPNEILLRIFDYACDMNLLREFPWSKDFKFLPSSRTVEPFRHLPAMSISSVCTRWRSVALSLSAIWSRISLKLSSENSRLPNVQSVLRSFLQTVELHLRRSRQHPLTVELDIRGAEDNSISRIPRPRFDSIRNCQSLKSLSFAVSADPDEELKLFQPARGNIDNVFKHAPSPKELVLGERKYDNILPVSPCAPPRLCTSVSTLKLELRQNWRNSLADVAFSSFTFPSLSCLAIESDAAHPYRGAWPKATLEAFLHRSSCNLTKFEVKKISVSDVDLIAALKLMPSLVNLHIDDRPAASDDQMSPITSRFIRSLHGFVQTELNPSGSALVPKLQDLHLTYDGSEFDDSAFIDMVSSRWLPDMQLFLIEKCKRSTFVLCRKIVQRHPSYPIRQPSIRGKVVTLSQVSPTDLKRRETPRRFKFIGLLEKSIQTFQAEILLESKHFPISTYPVGKSTTQLGTEKRNLRRIRDHDVAYVEERMELEAIRSAIRLCWCASCQPNKAHL
ncbi:hypothetical protein BDP27DRAFT_1402626 [Rhodocollybia butyracea]|uniref:F-box domain-containing protein n=1 Tax=Rhodocollybia butyracea TaxID=206335 RepID=A0A9P5PSV3_9AGAR|nr:hypothetical protein BDP27DRAFT_1402626 [Rhodocollybia butyracea]